MGTAWSSFQICPMGVTLGTCLSHLEPEKLWQVAWYEKTGTKSQQRSEAVTQPAQPSPRKSLQSLSLWKHIFIVQGCGVQPSCLLFVLRRRCHWLTLVPAAEPLSWNSEVGTQFVSQMLYWPVHFLHLRAMQFFLQSPIKLLNWKAEQKRVGYIIHTTVAAQLLS